MFLMCDEHPSCETLFSWCELFYYYVILVWNIIVLFSHSCPSNNPRSQISTLRILTICQIPMLTLFRAQILRTFSMQWLDFNEFCYFPINIIFNELVCIFVDSCFSFFHQLHKYCTSPKSNPCSTSRSTVEDRSANPISHFVLHMHWR